MTYPDREPRRPAERYPTEGYSVEEQRTEQMRVRRGGDDYPTQVGAPVPLDDEAARRDDAVRRENVVRREEVVDRPRDDHARIKTVMVVCAVIDVVCALFAIVLAVHIFLVIGGANAANGFAQMIESWSAAVSLGLRDLFTPENLGARTLLNDGLAAIIWLVLRAVLTNLITRLALPVGQRRVWYRRTASY
jgi:hypothetical protein